jgi:hypothetical protein
MFLVMVNEDNVLRELVLVTTNVDKARAQFLDTCSTEISNWAEYDEEDREAALDEGYERFGNAAVVLVDTDGPTSDAAIAAEINKTPPPGVHKITRWIRSGEIGEAQTIEEVIGRAGRILDKCESHEIFGEVVFEAEDGEVYVLTCEGGIGQANPEYLDGLQDES